MKARPSPTGGGWGGGAPQSSSCMHGRARASTPDKDSQYFIPANRQKTGILNLGYSAPFLQGRLALSAQATDKKIELVTGEQDQWSASASWTYRF